MSFKLSPSDRSILEALKAEEQKSGSAAEFARDFLPFSHGTWSKILNALDGETSYFDKVSETKSLQLLSELRGLAESIPLARARMDRFNEDEILPLSQFRAVIVSVNECRAKRNPERLTKYLAPTGGGKSMLCNLLIKRERAVVVEARESWKRSSFLVLQDICTAFRLALPAENSPSKLEDVLIKELSSKTQLLVIDEAEFFGASAINSLKLLLNKTRLVLLICAIPEAHGRWNRYYPYEAGQLARRTHAIVELAAINPKDAALFFPEDQFEDPDAALAVICDEASRFGHYSMIKRIARRLEDDSRVNAEAVDKAIRSARRQMVRELPDAPRK